MFTEKELTELKRIITNERYTVDQHIDMMPANRAPQERVEERIEKVRLLEGIEKKIGDGK